MTEDQVTAKLTELEARAKSNSHRLEHIEQEQTSLRELVQAVAVMTETQKRLTEDLGEIKADVQELKTVPVKRWEQVVDKLVFGVLGSGIGVIMATVLGQILK